MLNLRLIPFLALMLCLSPALRVHAQSPDDESAIEDELVDETPAAPTPKAEATPAPVIDFGKDHSKKDFATPIGETERPKMGVDHTKRDFVTPSTEAEKESSASGEPVFDWKKYKGAKEVPHPFAEKGLIRIDKDRNYIYKVDESPQTSAASFRIGVFNPTNLRNPDATSDRGATFSENYDQSTNPAIMIDYEWQLWKSAIGKIGLRAGSGVFIAQGNGHFVSDVNVGKTPREIFTFWAMPNTVGAVYRMALWDRQLLVPYAEGGGIGFAFGEFRDDNRPPKWGGALAAYFAGGLAINLTYFDAMSRIAIDREYGINRVYLTMEYRRIQAVTQRYDFSSNLINGGLLMEF